MKKKSFIALALIARKVLITASRKYFVQQNLIAVAIVDHDVLSRGRKPLKRFDLPVLDVDEMELMKWRRRGQGERRASCDGFAAILCDVPSTSRKRVDVESRKIAHSASKGWLYMREDISR